MTENNFWLLTLAFFIAAVASCSFSYLFIHAASRLGFVDSPDTHKVHKTPTPLLGGVGVFIGFAGSMLFLKFFFRENLHFFSFFLVSCLLVLILGVLDDWLLLTPVPKLAGLIFVSFIPGFCFYFLKGSLTTSIALSFCLFFFINSFNLLDNVDGLCSSVGLAILISAFIHSRNPYLLPAVGAIAGFLIWNYPKAKIFLGDAGSLLIGTFCVFFALSGYNNSLIHWSLLPVFWAPVYDTFSVVAIRLYEKRSIMIGGKDHLSHRLMSKGMTNSQVNILLGGSTIIVGISTLFLPVFVSVALLPVILIAVAVCEVKFTFSSFL